MRVLFVLFFIFIQGTLLLAKNDSLQLVFVKETTFIGNKKTKEFVLNRELTYRNKDSILLSELEAQISRSQENLFNTLLFNKVTSDYVILDSNKVEITFIVEERWYVWPYFILDNADRNLNVWWQTKDFSRLTYGVFLNWNNFRGRNEKLQIMAKVGFENQFSLGYKIPNINKAKTLGLHVYGGYSEFREVNYVSENNKRVFYKSLDGPGRQLSFGKVNLTFRKSLNIHHTIGLGFQGMKIDSAISDLSNDYLKNNKTQTEFLSLNYYGKYDTRDYIEYPLKGYKVELYVSQFGLGLLENEKLNVLTTTGGVYWYVPISKKWYFANSTVGKLSFFDDQPYSLQEGLGYKNAIRGYEYYVMDAQSYGIVKTNIKFALIKKKEMEWDWVPIKKFSKPYFSVYLSGFFDFGFANDQLYATQNPLSNNWAYGYGLGIDVTGFYDFIMRLEYSFNRENESGVFLHFKRAI